MLQTQDDHASFPLRVDLSSSGLFCFPNHFFMIAHRNFFLSCTWLRRREAQTRSRGTGISDVTMTQPIVGTACERGLGPCQKQIHVT